MNNEPVTNSTKKYFIPGKKGAGGNILRSEMAQDIVSHKPGFAEKWALLIILLLLVSLFGATWFIKYPDTITTSAILTASNAPKEIIIRQDGRLVKLFSHNNDAVKKGAVIGWIESTASHGDVISLSKIVDSSIGLLVTNQLAKASSQFNKYYTSLGEIQQNYQQFITAWQQFNDYFVNGFYLEKQKILEDDLSALDSMKKTIEGQTTLTRSDVQLAEESFGMQKQLFEEKVIPREEFRAEQSKLLNKQIEIAQLNATLLSSQTEKRNKLKELQQLQHDISLQKTLFLQALQSLKSVVDDWEAKYLLMSPVDGIVFFVIPLQENQFLKTGKLLGYFMPEDNHYYAETNLPQINLGKVDTGLQVQLRFDAYPYQETGFVEGKLSYVSKMASDSGFLATISLNNGLVTNNRIPIPYKNGLTAQAIVVTKNMRLLQRFYYTIIKSTSVAGR
jgi:HlyD family secretion protein